MCQSSSSCQLDKDGKVCMAASVLWMMTGHLLLIMEDVRRRQAKVYMLHSTTFPPSFSFDCQDRPHIQKLGSSPPTRVLSKTSYGGDDDLHLPGLPSSSHLTPRAYPLDTCGASLDLYSDVEDYSFQESLEPWSVGGQSTSQKTSKTGISV
jgi:hypothetical protein